MTSPQVAAKLGISRNTVARYARLMGLTAGSGKHVIWTDRQVKKLELMIGRRGIAVVSPVEIDDMPFVKLNRGQKDF